MQNLISIVATEPKAINTLKDSKGTNSSKTTDDSKDFVAILFDQIKNNIKNSIKTDKNISSKVQINLDNLLKSDKKKSSDELLLGEVLSMLSLLKNSDKNISFPKFSDKLDKIINNKVVLNEFKGVKNIGDLIKLSKKYSLGLENIKFSKEDIKTLQKDFPKLAKKEFFNIKDDLKTSTTNQDKIPTKNEKTIIIEKLVNNLSKKAIKKENSPKNILQNILKNIDENTKKVIVKTKEEDKKNKVDKFIKQDTKIVKNIDTKDTKIVKNIDTKDTKIVKTTKNSKSKVAEQNSLNANVSRRGEKTILKDKILDKKAEQQSYKETINKAETLPRDTKNKRETNSIKIEKTRNFDNTKNISIKTDEESTKIRKNITLNSTQNISTGLDKESDSKKETKDIKHDPVIHKTEVKNNVKAEIFKTDKNKATRGSLNQFANDLREKIESYKPPIMKLQMSLVPKNLGEVEVTLLNRGNNLHVNITSNTNAMSLFTQNQAEFKNSLVNMGFTNLEMNFSDQGKSNQQHQNSRQNRDSSFEEAQDQHDHESTIELVVPQYI